MQFVIETSIRYLEEEIILCARYISLFPGSFSKEAGVSILSGCGVEDAPYCLNTLSHKSLLERYTVRKGSRYRYHRLVRDAFVAIGFLKSTHDLSIASDGKQTFYEHYSSYFTTHLMKSLEECESGLNEDCKYWIRLEKHNTGFMLAQIFYSFLRKTSKHPISLKKFLLYYSNVTLRLYSGYLMAGPFHLEHRGNFGQYCVRQPDMYCILGIFLSSLLILKFRVYRLQSHGRHSNRAIGVAGMNGLAFTASLLASTKPVSYTTGFVESYGLYEAPIVDYTLLCALLIAFAAIIMMTFAESYVIYLMFFSLSFFSHFAFLNYSTFYFHLRAQHIVLNLVMIVCSIMLKKPLLESISIAFFHLSLTLLCRVLAVYLYGDIFPHVPIILSSNVIILWWFVWMVCITSFLQHKQSIIHVFLILLVACPLLILVVTEDYPFLTLFFML